MKTRECTECRVIFEGRGRALTCSKACRTKRKTRGHRAWVANTRDAADSTVGVKDRFDGSHSRYEDAHRYLATVVLWPLVHNARQGNEEAKQWLARPSAAVQASITLLQVEETIERLT